MTSLPTRLTAERVAEIAARDAHSITWYGNFSEVTNEAQADRRALLAHVAALEGELAEALHKVEWRGQQLDKLEEHRTSLFTEIRDLRDAKVNLEAALAACRRDAENWRALMACRMRTLGGAKVKEPDDPWTYLVLEFWTGHPDPTDQPWLAEHFELFMAKARKAALCAQEGEVTRG